LLDVKSEVGFCAVNFLSSLNCAHLLWACRWLLWDIWHELVCWQCSI